MRIGVIGLGLIGASLAGALKKAGHHVLGFDKNKKIMDFAVMAGTVDGELAGATCGDEKAPRDDCEGEKVPRDDCEGEKAPRDDCEGEKAPSTTCGDEKAQRDPKDCNDISSCEVIILAVTPGNAIKWLEDNSGNISSDTLVLDCCGTKRRICEAGFKLSKEYGFSFCGGHPMAGKQVGGYKNSGADLFKGALFVLSPEDASDIAAVERVKNIMKDAGFTRFSLMTPEEHDRIIAFTSQLVHLVSNAYIKSDVTMEPEAASISGGAFRDMTRVAYLDEDMWTELFIENRENLLQELRSFIIELGKYEKAIEEGNESVLTQLLAEGKKRKEEIEKLG